MKKYWFIFLLLLINEISLEAQPVFPDSLRHALKNSPADSNYVNSLIAAILYLPYSQPDSALYYADYALKLSQQLNFNRGIAYSCKIMAECYVYTGDYSKSVFYIYQHLNLFTAMGDIDGINRAYGQLSEVYAELGDYRKALEFVLKKNARKKDQRRSLGQYCNNGFSQRDAYWHSPLFEIIIDR
jgi:tetratricopeptide (TPR) repeat protein